MPALDAVTQASRNTTRTRNKARAKRVRAAKNYLTKPLPAGSAKPAAPVRAPVGQIDRGGAAAQKGAEKNYVLDEAKRLTKAKHRTLKKQETTIHELARLGILPRGYLSGVESQRRADVAKANKLVTDAAARVQAVSDGARARASSGPHPGLEPLGPEDPRLHTVYPGINTYKRGDVYKPEAPGKDASETDKLIYKRDKAAYDRGDTHDSPSALASAISGIPGGLARSAAALVEGTARDPIGVPSKTLKQGALAVSAIPAGVVGIALHPGQTAKGMVADYSKRNSETYQEKLKRVRKEGGFAEASDLATAFSLGGAGAAKAALIRNAPERATKLLSGGATKTPKKGGPVRYGIGTAVDKRKAAKYEKIAAKAEQGKGPGLTALQHEALLANRAAGRVVAVVPRRSARKIAREGVAKPRGQAVAGLKYDQAKGPFAALAKEKYNLNKDEAAALWLGTEVGIRDAATARSVGTKLRDKMQAERGEYTPTGWEKDMDVIAQIDKILENPEKHFTPRFAEVMDRIHEHAQQVSDLEPQFRTETKENRRRAAQAYALDLKQGEGREVPGVPARPVEGPLEAPFARTKTGEAKYELDDLPEYVHDYQPSAEGVSAKTWYHGTNTKDLKPEDLDGTQTQIDSLFGQGVYLTDDRHTAQSYANSRSRRRGEPTVYAAKVHVKNPLDMDAPASTVFHSALNRQAKSIGHLGGNHHDPDPFILDEMAKMLAEKDGKHTNADLYSAFRNAVIEYAQDYGLSRGDITEYFQDLASDLRHAGFDALTHVGGLRAGHGDRLHQVTILLDPANTGSLKNADRQAKAFDVAADAPKTGFTVGKYAGVPRADRGPKGEAVPAVPPLKYEPETDADFNARIDDTAAKAGLSAPTYFRSEKQQGLTSDFGAHVVGGTAKSTGKQYLGKNLGQGIFDTTYEQFVRGYAHNLKATHNYPLIAKLDDKNRLRSFSPDSQPQGAELGELMNRVNRAEPRVQKGSVVFVNKGLFEKTLDDLHDGGKESDYDTSEDGMDAATQAAFDKAVVREGDVTPELSKTPGWVAWPVEADRELQAELHAGTMGGRMLDIAKGTASKAILLTGNLPWIALQAASEFATVGVASKGRAITPRNMLGTARWWKAMNHRQRTHVSTELGLGATGSDTAAIRLGATTNNHLVNAWRDLKADDFWHRPRALTGGVPVASIISPVKWMRAADQGKTNVTRLLLGHHELTKKLSPEGQAGLGDALTNMSKFGKDADRLLPIFDKPAAEQLEFLQAHPELLERMGENVSNALGDWTTMTAKERTWANRFVMFYPFVRYSTRLLFHTLPVDHPAVTSALAELGQFTAEEYRSVFGDDDLPWNIGKVYFGKTGESRYIDLTRANPALNMVVGAAARLGSSSSNIPGAVTGALPPYFQWAVDQATGVNTFKGRPLRFNGDTDPFWNKPTDISLADRGQLLTAQIQSLFYPARETMTRTHPESQSDESSLLFPQAMNYKSSREIKGNSEDAKIRRASARAAERTEAFNGKNDGGIADLLVGPLAPRASRDAAAAKDREYIKQLKAAQAKKAAERKKYRDSHGGKNKPKPSGFGSGGGGGFGGGSGGSFGGSGSTF